MMANSNVSQLRRLLERVLQVLDWLTGLLGRSLGLLALLMMLLTCMVVLLRYAFGIGAILLQELVIYLHGTLFMLGAAYCLREDAHVRVDFLYSRYKPRTRALVNLVGHLCLLLPLCVFMLHISADYVARSWRIMEGSREVGGLPAVFLLKTLIPAAAVLLLIQALVESLRILLRWPGAAATAVLDDQSPHA